MKKILVVDDKKNICKTLSAILRKEGYNVQSVNNGWDALHKTRKFKPDLIISDIKMPDMDGIEFFNSLQAEKLNIPLIFITAYGSIPLAVETVKDGAVDFLTKPLDYNKLKLKIKKYIGSTVFDQSEQPKQDYQFKKIIGSSQKMKELYKIINTAAKIESTVLILGESGVGKELAARAVHYLSGRSEHNFVALNCAALNTEIFESELFGHKKGSFTGAIEDKEGKFKLADKGTILLDEISEIDLRTQAKLLRVLQEKSFEKVGDNKTYHVDVKIIASSNRDLKKMVEQGEFRKDLFYRINVMKIVVPPLREHKEDIRELTDYFTKKICSTNKVPQKEIDEDVYRILLDYDWPGNVRELRNVLERSLMLSESSILSVHDLPLDIKKAEANIDEKKSESEREEIIKILKKTYGNKSRAAELLQMSRKTIYNKIDKYSIKKEEYI
jgi:two-component system response regulator AtoC